MLSLCIDAPKGPSYYPKKHHVSVSNVMATEIRHKKRKLTKVSGAKLGTDSAAAQSWVKDFILPHKYHAPNFYQIFCHTLAN